MKRYENSKSLYTQIIQFFILKKKLTWITWAICWEKMSNSWISAGMPDPSSFCANWASLLKGRKKYADFTKDIHTL